MALTPQFMQHPDDYERELAEVRGREDWLAFRKKWFDTAKWPRKTREQIVDEARNKRGPIFIGGRKWGYTNLAYDITPESRYEYVRVLSSVGGPFAFPGWNDSRRTAENGWTQECPYCEISTTQLGDTVCPRCGRQLIDVWSGD